MINQAINSLVLICLDADADVWQVIETECYGLSFCRQKRVLFEGTFEATLKVYRQMIGLKEG